MNASTITALPAGLTARPLRPDEVDAVLDLIRESEEHDAGEALVERSDIEADWARPSTDLSLDTIAVHDERGHLLGMAEMGRGGTRAEVYVRPGARGRGIGAFLAGWAERRAAELGAERVGQAVPEGSAPHRFLEARGYDVAWTSWVLQLLDGAAIPERTLPPG